MSENFVQVPWSIESSELDPYQFRLWVHISRVGVCWQSIRTMAEACNMSVAKTHEVKNWLLENGYIEAAIDEKGKRIGVSACSPDEQTQQEAFATRTERSPHEQNVRHANKKRSPHERHLKKNPNKNNPEVEEGAAHARDAKDTFENHFGGLSPIIIKEIEAASERHGERVVMDAILEGASSGGRSWNYVNTILRRWEREGRAPIRGSPPVNGHRRPDDPNAELLRLVEEQLKREGLD